MSCPHRSECCCKIGRFGGRPSIGVCVTVCEIGAALEWPTVKGATVGNDPKPCEGCGEGFNPPARMDAKQ